MTDGISSMDSPLTGSARPEKVLWYREVLSLDPNSRIFLPYARLLAELGQSAEAMEVLKAGLVRHPEFLEARLLLIDLLHAAGQDAAAGFEAEGIIEQLSQSSALWTIWSRMPGLRADQSAMLLFFGASLKKGGLRLGDVFEAGIRALSDEVPATAPAPEMPAPPQVRAASEAPAPVGNGSAPCPKEASAPSPATEGGKAPCFVMDEASTWYSLDSVPEDDDIYDEDDAPAPGLPLPFPVPAAFPPVMDTPPLPTEVPTELPAEPAGEPHVPAMRAVPRSAGEGKSSLCTRSMARVLEEQGATGEAADIYRELLATCSSGEERSELNAKLESLLQGTENAAPVSPASSGILDMLETLAERLENKSRA